MILLLSLIHSILSLVLLPWTKHSKLALCGYFVVVQLFFTTCLHHSLEIPYSSSHNSIVPYNLGFNNSYHCSFIFLMSESKLDVAASSLLSKSTNALAWNMIPNVLSSYFFCFLCSTHNWTCFSPGHPWRSQSSQGQMTIHYYNFPIYTSYDLFIPFCLKHNCVVFLALIWSPNQHYLWHLQNTNGLSIIFSFSKTQNHI